MDWPSIYGPADLVEPYSVCGSQHNLAKLHFIDYECTLCVWELSQL